MLVNPALQSDFRFSIKQKGGLQAKVGCAAQFEPLFNDDLYFKLGSHLMRWHHNSLHFAEKGFQFLAPVESNQVFVIFPNALANKLLTHYQLSNL